MNKEIESGIVRSLVGTITLATAATTLGTAVTGLAGIKYLVVEAKFVRIGGGTAVKVYIQTSLDGGTTWIDIMSITFTTTTANKVSAVSTAVALAASITPGDGALSDDTILNGLLGDRIRAKVVATGTYTGASTLDVLVVGKA